MDFSNAIELNNIEVYYLASELKKRQLIGIDLDLESVNKENKLAIKEEGYLRFEEDGIIQQDFSGNVIVDEKYKEIIDFIEYPHYCGIIELVNVKDKTSKLRKIYRIDDKYIGLEYTSSLEFGVLNIDSEHNANAFMFSDISKPEFKEAVLREYDSEDEIINDSDEALIFSEYFIGKNEYDFIQTVSYQIDGIWYSAEKNNENKKYRIVPCEDNFILG